MAEQTPQLDDIGQAAIQVQRALNLIYPTLTWDDNVRRTAERIVRYWAEFQPTNPDFRFTTFESSVQQMILVRDVEFESVCMHHLLPFWGKAYVAYIPHELMVGVSKIPRLVRWMAKTPSVQENLTHWIASWMKDRLKAKGVAVVLKATHTCMSCRGVKARGAEMVTSEMRGVFLTAPAARAEFLEMIR